MHRERPGACMVHLAVCTEVNEEGNERLCRNHCKLNRRRPKSRCRCPRRRSRCCSRWSLTRSCRLSGPCTSTRVAREAWVGDREVPGRAKKQETRSGVGVRRLSRACRGGRGEGVRSSCGESEAEARLKEREEAGRGESMSRRATCGGCGQLEGEMPRWPGYETRTVAAEVCATLADEDKSSGCNWQ